MPGGIVEGWGRDNRPNDADGIGLHPADNIAGFLYSGGIGQLNGEAQARLAHKTDSKVGRFSGGDEEP